MWYWGSLVFKYILGCFVSNFWILVEMLGILFKFCSWIGMVNVIFFYCIWDLFIIICYSMGLEVFGFYICYGMYECYIWGGFS